MIELAAASAVAFLVGLILGRRRRVIEFHWTPRTEYTAPVAFTRSVTRAGGEAVRLVRE